MNLVEIIARKRDGIALSDRQISELIRTFTDGSLPDYQMAALAMAIYFQGMDRDEVVSLTRNMLESGEVFNWTGIDRPVVDKHSTGGIGDKISIVLAPLLAAAGMAVPMISGRGLGATGGTLDKLESIPGFNVNLSMEAIRKQIKDIGCVIAGATKQIAPADQRLYALRDVTATVPSIPLITSSILSKKLAEGLDALVLDVKFGSGAFMKSPEKAMALARSLVMVACQLGVPTTAMLTDMNQPNGRMVGNANEVNESVEVLTGGGPQDVRNLTIELATAIHAMTGVEVPFDAAQLKAKYSKLLDGGEAMENFERMLHAQGACWTRPLDCEPAHPVIAKREGWIVEMDAEQLGWIVIDLGGGRTRLGDRLNHATGIEMCSRIGDQVVNGQPLANLLCNRNDFRKVNQRLLDAIRIGEEPPETLPLIAGLVTNENTWTIRND